MNEEISGEKESEGSNKTGKNYLPQIIIRHQLLWDFVIFIILNYYLIEVVLASTFYSMFIATKTTLLPLNIFFFILLFLDLLYKFGKVERMNGGYRSMSKNFQTRKISNYIKYFLFKKLLILDCTILIIFYSSYIVAFDVARWLRLVIVVRILEITDFNQTIYKNIYKSIWLTKLYTIFKITYIMFIISHYFGCWFYLMDQLLINSQFYGSPAIGNQLYYQLNMLCYTPIEQLGDWGRYLYGVYFMSSLISTIAYGDIVGKNPIEEIYVTILMVLSTISIGMILQQFMNIVRDDRLGQYDFIKNYNSLKTFMDDSFVSITTQNKVRSYLVYNLYEQKYHAHENVVEKLTEKLQEDLKEQSYAKFISPIFYNLLGQSNNNLNVRDLCNICSEISFQAQTDVYDELLTIDWRSQCSFLFKMEGLCREYVPLGRNRYYLNSKYAQTQKRMSEGSEMSSFLPTEGKSFYNLPQFLLNFQRTLHGRDEHEEALNDLFFQASQDRDEDQPFLEETTTTNVDIYRFYLRRLKSIKITHFILIRLEDFEEYLRGRDEVVKEIRKLKQKIYCEEIDLRKIGMHCSVCEITQNQNQNTNSFDHTAQKCPKLHYICSEKLTGRLLSIFSQTCPRKKFPRKNLKSRKRFNLPHPTSYIKLLLKQDNDIERQKVEAEENNIFYLLKKVLNNIIENKEEEAHKIDSAYEHDAAEREFCLDLP